MPYSKEHRAKVRDRIVESARRLFNRNGFENVSIDSIMEEAGLTRGGFYAYFKCKSDLYVEAMSCFFTDPGWKNRWRASSSIPLHRKPPRKSCAPICPVSILMTWTTHAQWWRSPTM